MKKINLNYNQFLELKNILDGSFFPLKGFMTEDEFISVVETMKLPNKKVFPLPVFQRFVGGTCASLNISQHLPFKSRCVRRSKV